MAGLAVLLKARGDEVTGCDVHASARTRWLEAQGIPVAVGHSAAHLRGVDEAVVTPAVRGDEPEIAGLADGAGPRLRFRGEVLAEVANGRETIAVCGSHGKTTTATWIAKLLRALGEDVAWCIGGETGDFPVARAASAPACLVVEADESDGTLALYHARTLVVNKCDYDHPDHFKTEADYFACYETAKRNAAEVIESEVLGELPGLGFLSALAPHNRRNARAAVEVALRRGHRLADIARALPPVVSVLPDRRFQTIWPAPPQSNNPNTRTLAQSPLVIADYAHHPAEMKCAIGMARQRCRGRLRVLFQPHRYSRTKALLRDFPAAFAEADEVTLCPTYAAFERPVAGGDVTDLYAACREFFGTPRRGGRGVVLRLAESCEAAWERAFADMADGDLTLLLGAGDIINLVPLVRRDMARR